MNRDRTLIELFSLPGFRANNQLQGIFGDPKSRIVVLSRQKKQQYVPVVGKYIKHITIEKNVKHAILTYMVIAFTCTMKGVAYFVFGVKACV